MATMQQGFVRYTAFIGLAALSLATLPVSALAQGAANYPSKPVRIVVPLAPGGPVDSFGRLYANFLEKKYKQPVVVENKTGAGQVVGANYAIQQPADGYTLLVGSNSLAWESLINKEVPFNSTKDIQPFGAFAGSGMFVQINPSLPVNTLQEFIAWVRANPGKLNLGTASVPLAAFEAMRDKLGLQWTAVNYKGGTPAEAAVLGGEVQAYFGDVKGVYQMRAGKLRVLAYSGATRHPAAPEIPTVAESNIGYPEMNYQIWLGMYAAPAVPEDIVTKLNADIIEMNNQPDIQARYKAMGWLPMTMSVSDVRKDSAKANKEVADLLAKGVKLR